MPYFHAVALFEGRGSSLNETDQAVASLLASISHRRLRCYEHETTEGPRSDGTAYFVIFADFDVEAHTEEKAADLVDEVLDAVSTDAIQYFSHGLLSGEQRVQPARQTSAQEDQQEQNDQNAQNDQEEGRGQRSSRGGRRRGTRGRGRGQTGEAAIASAVTDETLPDAAEAETVRPSDAPHADLLVDATAPAEDPEALIVTEQSYEQDQQDELNELNEPTDLIEIPLDLDYVNEQDQLDEPTDLIEISLDLDHDLPAVPPVRSSSAMQTKTSVTLRASELGFSPNKGALPGEEELIALAATEARRRHPALPADTAPEAEMTTLPWGDVVLTLTWSDDVPVPSADKDA